MRQTIAVHRLFFDCVVGPLFLDRRVELRRDPLDNPRRFRRIGPIFNGRRHVTGTKPFQNRRIRHSARDVVEGQLVHREIAFLAFAAMATHAVGVEKGTHRFHVRRFRLRECS
ncbi:MAG: hypothetical protein WCL32_11010 [Planctomycetota bacterium]